MTTENEFDTFEKKVKKEAPKKYFIKYLGKGNIRVIRVPGVSKVEPHKEYLVTKTIADSFKNAENWEVVEK